jgi:hypothetical protein
VAFDVDAFREAHRPWSFTVGARTFTGRHVSAPAVQRYERLRMSAKNESQLNRALWSVLRRAFPWRVSYLVRGDPVQVIMRELERPARDEALKDFFVCLRGGKSENPSQMSGTHSPRPTPHRVA